MHPTFWINPLHQLETLHGRVFDAAPPDGARIVHQDIEPPELSDGFIDQVGNGLKISDVDLQC